MEKTPETNETNETNETPETNDPIICPTCNEEQLKIITVSICEAKNTLWYKCSNSTKCKLFQIKNK